MKTGAEMINAIRVSTDAAFEEFGEGAAEFLDKLVSFIHEQCDQKGIQGRDRTATIFFEGMLRGCQTQFRRKALAEKAWIESHGVDPETGLAKGKAS